ncbi:MAG: site-2 protease family protein [Halodesulfurarchaeum sp.]
MRNYTITRIWDIPIRINVSLVVFLPLLAWLIGSGGQIEVYAGLIEGLTGVGFDLGALRAGTVPWVIGILAAVGLFASVTVHELGHSWVALRYGISIESITLWILGGIAALGSIPREWNREFWIAIAGPIASLLVGAVCWLGVQVIPPSLPIARFVVGWLAITNVVLAAFNLLPAFPMDGGRILRAVLARSRPYGSATRIAARIGVIFALLFAVVGVLNFNVILLLLAVFIYGAATTESRTVLVDELLEGLTVGDVMQREQPTIAGSTTVDSLVDRMIRDRRTAYPVSGESGAIVGVVSLPQLRGIPTDQRSSATVDDVRRDVPRLSVDQDAFEALTALSGSGADLALVESEGGVVGVISNEDFASALTIRKGFQTGIPR